MAVNRDQDHTKHDYITRSGNLGRVLGINPAGLDLAALAADMHAALDNHRNVGLNRAAQQLGAMIFTALPAYRSSGAAGARLPTHDNRIHHVPRPDGGDELHQDFTWDAWASYVVGLGQWVAGATGNSPGMYRLEEAAVGLLLDNPTIDVGPRTVTLLAGAYGIEAMVQLVDEHYSVGTVGHMPLDADDQDLWDQYNWEDEDQPQTKPNIWDSGLAGWPADYSSRR